MQRTAKYIWLFTDKNLPDKECLCWIAFKISNGTWIKVDTCWYKPNIGWQCDEEMEILAYIEIKDIPEFSLI